MFKKLPSGAGRTFVCPECGVCLEGKPERRAQLITCPACGTKASVAEWTRWPTGEPMVGRADIPPPGTKIRRESGPEGTVWHIPASGKFGSFLFFGLVWTLITALLSGVFLTAFLTHGNAREEMPIWLLIPFFSIFWVIGVAMLYSSVRRKWVTHRLTVGNGVVVLRREIFGRGKEKSLPISGIQTIGQKEFYQQNYRSVYGIEIKGARGKLRFGSVLDAAEKSWLVADLRETVYGRAVPPAPVKAPEPRAVFHRNEAFSVEIPNARKHLWPLVIASVVVGSVFLIISLTLLNEPWEMGKKADPIIIRVFEAFFTLVSHGMQAIFFVAGLAFFIGGVALFIHFLRSHGTLMKLEGNSVEIAIRTYRHNLVWKEKTYPRGQIADIRASQSGSSGTTVMKRIDLIAGEEVVKLASWIDGNAADALVERVRSSL